MPDYSETIDNFLNDNSSLLNNAPTGDVLSTLDNTEAIPAEMITDGVIGGVGNISGIQVETDKSTGLTSLRSRNFVTGSTGWEIQGDGDVEFNSGIFRGSLEAGSIHIPDQDSTANSFHVDTDGSGWVGATETNRATAPMKWTAGGELTVSDLVVTGASGIASFNDSGNLVTVNEADVDALILTNAPADAGATLQTATSKVTGENITIRNCLSMGHTGVDVGSTVIGDSWADEANSSTTHGSDDDFRVGQNATPESHWGYVKIAIPAGITNKDITTAIIKFQVASGSSLGASNTLQFHVHRLTASFDESTLDWDDKPANDAGVAGSSAVFNSIPSTGTWVEVDITQLFKDWNDNTFTNHGVAIKFSVGVGGGSQVGYFNFFTSDAAGDIQPRFDITGWADKDQVYKADADGWEGVKQIIGFATETITSGNSIRIQTSGILDGFSTLVPGSPYYVDSTAGAITVTPGTGGGRKKIGTAISTTELEIDLDPPLEYVETEPESITTGGGATWTERDISASVPKRSKIADIECRIRVASETLGVRKTDSALDRKLSAGAGGAEMRFFNMQTEISEDEDGIRSVENYSSDGTSTMSIIGYWI